MSGFTLGHLFIAVAIVDLVVIWRMSRSMLAADPGSEDRRRAARIVMAAGLATSAALIVLAFVLPVASLRLA